MTGETALIQVFRSAEFRALWSAELLSVLGDQLARVALAVLVYDRTTSAGWAAVTYALTFLPALFGGLLLGGIADRFSRRTVMILVDLMRAGILAGMTVPAVPLWLLGVLLVVSVLLGPLHKAAQGALLPDVLAGTLYERGLAVRQITGQSAQIVGFGVGGLVLVVLSPAAALAIDALTFAASAVLLLTGVRQRPPAAPTGPHPARPHVRERLRLVAADPRRRVLLVFAWLIGCYVVPEGLAAPYAAAAGAGPAAVAALMASLPAGGVAGAWAFTRFVRDERRPRLIGALAVLSGIPLLACLFGPGVPVTVGLWALTGACSTAYLVQTQASFVRATPTELRGQAIGVASAGIVAAQGIALLVAAPVAEAIGPAGAVALSGAVGVLVAALAALAWSAAGAGAGLSRRAVGETAAT